MRTLSLWIYFCFTSGCERKTPYTNLRSPNERASVLLCQRSFIVKGTHCWRVGGEKQCTVSITSLSWNAYADSGYVNCSPPIPSSVKVIFERSEQRVGLRKCHVKLQKQAVVYASSPPHTHRVLEGGWGTWNDLFIVCSTVSCKSLVDTSYAHMVSLLYHSWIYSSSRVVYNVKLK